MANMSPALRQPMTLEAFLGWEERQELRYEFDGFGPMALTGGTLAHSIIQGNLMVALATRLRGGPCRAHGSDLKVLAADRVRYPDVFVVCGPLDAGLTLIRTPVVVFEILSRRSATTDRIVKNQEYRETPSIQRYVMLEQTRQAATVFARQGEDWIGHIVVGDAELAMPEIGVSVPLSEFHEEVAFPAEDVEAAEA